MCNLFHFDLGYNLAGLDEVLAGTLKNSQYAMPGKNFELEKRIYFTKESKFLIVMRFTFAVFIW